MHNKRREDTDTKRAGTETGSVTYTVTLYPTVFEEDALLVEELIKLAKVKKANPYIRELAVAQFMGGSREPVQKQIPAKNIVKRQSAPSGATSDNTVADDVASSMGLKF